MQPLAFFGMGDTEILVIMAVILIFFGGEKMPELARGLGKMMREFRKATSDVEREFRRVMDEAENPASTIYNAAMTSPPQSQPYTPPAETAEASGDPRDQAELDQATKPAAPAAWPSPRSEAPKAPPSSTTHQVRDTGEADFHSDI